MSTPDIATRLLLATDEAMSEEARALALQLDGENVRRQEEEADILAAASPTGRAAAFRSSTCWPHSSGTPICSSASAATGRQPASPSKPRASGNCEPPSTRSRTRRWD